MLLLLQRTEAFKIFANITKFLNITTVIDKEATHIEQVLQESEYLGKIEQLKRDVKKYYEYGKDTFLTKTMIGDKENFYMHCLRYYIPQLAERIWQKHYIRLEIFTMQGYERQNKEFKNILKRFTNSRGNVLLQNIKRVDNIFW